MNHTQRRAMAHLTYWAGVTPRPSLRRPLVRLGRWALALAEPILDRAWPLVALLLWWPIIALVRWVFQ